MKAETQRWLYFIVLLVVVIICFALLKEQHRNTQRQITMLMKNCNFSSAEFNETTRKMARLNAEGGVLICEDIETLKKINIVQFELYESIIDAIGIKPEPMNSAVYAVEVEHGKD